MEEENAFGECSSIMHQGVPDVPSSELRQRMRSRSTNPQEFGNFLFKQFKDELFETHQVSVVDECIDNESQEITGTLSGGYVPVNTLMKSQTNDIRFHILNDRIQVKYDLSPKSTSIITLRDATTLEQVFKYTILLIAISMIGAGCYQCYITSTT